MIEMMLFAIIGQDLPDLGAIRESDPVAYTVAAVLLAGLLGLLRLYVLKDKKVDELQEKRVAEALEALVINKDATGAVQELAKLTNQLLDTARVDQGVKVEAEEIKDFLNRFSVDLATRIASLEELLRAIQSAASRGERL